MQVVEARGLLAKDFNGKSDPYVLCTYNKRAASTRTVYCSLSPVWGDVLLFQENRCVDYTRTTSCRSAIAMLRCALAAGGCVHSLFCCACADASHCVTSTKR